MSGISSEELQVRQKNMERHNALMNISTGIDFLNGGFSPVKPVKYFKLVNPVSLSIEALSSMNVIAAMSFYNRAKGYDPVESFYATKYSFQALLAIKAFEFDASIGMHVAIDGLNASQNIRAGLKLGLEAAYASTGDARTKFLQNAADQGVSHFRNLSEAERQIAYNQYYESLNLDEYLQDSEDVGGIDRLGLKVWEFANDLENQDWSNGDAATEFVPEDFSDQNLNKAPLSSDGSGALTFTGYQELHGEQSFEEAISNLKSLIGSVTGQNSSDVTLSLNDFGGVDGLEAYNHVKGIIQNKISANSLSADQIINNVSSVVSSQNATQEQLQGDALVLPDGFDYLDIDPDGTPYVEANTFVGTFGNRQYYYTTATLADGSTVVNTTESHIPSLLDPSFNTSNPLVRSSAVYDADKNEQVNLC